MKKLAALAVGCALIAGCASTTIYPGENNTFTSVTTSSDQGVAEKDALKKANEHCKKMGKRLVVLNRKSHYQGMKKSDAAVIGAVSTFLTGVNTAHRSDDNKVTLRFRCR